MWLQHLFQESLEDGIKMGKHENVWHKNTSSKNLLVLKRLLFVSWSVIFFFNTNEDRKKRCNTVRFHFTVFLNIQELLDAASGRLVNRDNGIAWVVWKVRMIPIYMGINRRKYENSPLQAAVEHVRTLHCCTCLFQMGHYYSVQ